MLFPSRRGRGRFLADFPIFTGHLSRAGAQLAAAVDPSSYKQLFDVRRRIGAVAPNLSNDARVGTWKISWGSENRK